MTRLIVLLWLLCCCLVWRAPLVELPRLPRWRGLRLARRWALAGCGKRWGLAVRVEVVLVAI